MGGRPPCRRASRADRPRLGHHEPARLPHRRGRAVLEQRERDAGILKVAGGALRRGPGRGRRRLARGRARPAGAGGRHDRQPPGLARGALCRLPRRAAELAAGLVHGEGGRRPRTVRLVPGLSRARRRRLARRDARRGDADPGRARRPRERTAAASSCPGPTASGLEARTAGSRSFATYMTGEVFDVLRRHSILGRLMERRARPMPTPSHRGLDQRAGVRGGGPGRLLHDAVQRPHAWPVRRSAGRRRWPAISAAC